MWIHTTFLFLLIGALSGLSQDGYLDKSIRNSRAANVTSVLPLRTILENLAVLARVTNAVSLTAALLQKTFPFRTIIGEIMETEPSVVGEIAKHDPSQINSHLHRMLNRVNNAYLTVILISVAIFLIVLIGIISIYGLTSSGRRNFAIWYLYYFGKPENFENRWRYSLFLDRKDGENGLLGAVRESNKAHALKFIKKGAFINAYNHHGNTLLHSATKLGKVELVEILIKNGADLTLLNAKNKTAEEILVSETKLAHGDKKEQFETIGLIYKKYGKKKFRIQVPEIFPVSSFHIFIDKETDDNVTNKFLLVFQSITSMEPLPNTTHCIVQTEFDGTLKTNDLDLLIWILNGIIFVKESWMTDCLDNEKLIKRDCEYLVEKVKYKNTVYNTVLQWSEAMAKSTMPYLYGAHVVISMKKCENLNKLTALVTIHGCMMLAEFPEKNNYNVGSHPYLHAHLGPLFIIHDGSFDLTKYKNDPDKMYTLLTEEEFMHFMLKREINVDKRPNPTSAENDN